ncbi:hypothetical protein BpHYR1_048818 [Brachionus plicatilis]|uniref:Uncharacterized protein n=1 Tax=Brachionus plicatilis TaxID=10195 RepID=A0A3M7QY36_BRAPC|nr:hypothetical protein BpHYR1_048818 [Brachionus plicatilis]
MNSTLISFIFLYKVNKHDFVPQKIFKEQESKAIQINHDHGLIIFLPFQGVILAVKLKTNLKLKPKSSGF